VPVVQPEPAPSPQSAISAFSFENDEALEAAVADAKAKRAAGNFKALASTPDEFARELGKLNFRLVDFTARFEEIPAPEDTGYTAYKDELDKLTTDLANLFSDDSLAEKSDEENTAQLAHHQALLAAGGLALSDDTTAKVEELLKTAYAKILPPDQQQRALTPEEEAEFGKKFDAMTGELEQQLRPLLSPEQIKRLELLGIDQVFFGLEE
jgi:hypothetical protein